MRRTKRLGALLIALVMLFTMIPFTTAGAASLSGNIVLVMNSDEFTVNGTKTKIDAQGSKPVQGKGYTMLPLRAILEATGGTLTYDGATQKITIVRGGDTVVLTLNSKTAVVNGANRTLGAAPYAVNGRTMVHIRTLELFGMKVDWNSSNNNVTVNYVEPTKIFNLTLQNGMGTAYTSVQIAPMTTGTPDWSGNLLGADTLSINQNLIVQAPITGTGFYQLRCGYASSGQTMYHTISNINLTGMTDRATILMNNATAPGVSLDGASATSRNIQLYIVNNTGKTLTQLYCKLSTEQYYDQNKNLLNSQLLSNKGTATTTINHDNAKPYYDFFALCSDGTTEHYTNVTIATATTQQNFATVTLSANGTASSGGTSSGTSTGDTEITFRNNSGKRIYELRASTSSGDSSIKNGTVVWSDSDGVKDGSTVTFKMDLKDTYRWYFGAYDSKKATGNPDYSSGVNFKTSGVTSARLTLTTEDDGYELCDYGKSDCDGCYDEDLGSSAASDRHAELKKDYGSEITTKKYDEMCESSTGKKDRKHYEEQEGDATFELSQIKTDGSKTNTSGNDGEIDLNLVAYYDDIKAFYVISRDDYRDSSMSDPDDFEDAYEDLLSGTLDKGESELIDDALEGGTNYVAWVVGKKLYKGSLSVDDDATWVSALNKSSNSLDYNDSENEKVLILLENDGAGSGCTVKMTNDTHSTETVSVSNNSFSYIWLTIKKDADWTFDVSGTSYSFSREEIDLDEYDGFVHATFTERRFEFDKADD